MQASTRGGCLLPVPRSIPGQDFKEIPMRKNQLIDAISRSIDATTQKKAAAKKKTKKVAVKKVKKV
jgi:hypothetical protein